jgi:thioredoxin 1
MKEQQMKNKTNCATFAEVNFQDEVIESKLPVLAVFEADWSGTCEIMTPILEDLCEEFRGRVKIGLIDFDSNGKLKEEYCINNIPTLIFFNGGEIVDHITGLAPRHEIAGKLNDMVLSANK